MKTIVTIDIRQLSTGIEDKNIFQFSSSQYTGRMIFFENLPIDNHTTKSNNQFHKNIVIQSIFTLKKAIIHFHKISLSNVHRRRHKIIFKNHLHGSKLSNSIQMLNSFMMHDYYSQILGRNRRKIRQL